MVEPSFPFVPWVALYQIAFSPPMHPSHQQTDVPPSFQCQLRWGREPLLRSQHGFLHAHRHRPVFPKVPRLASTSGSKCEVLFQFPVHRLRFLHISSSNIEALQVLLLANSGGYRSVAVGLLPAVPLAWTCSPWQLADRVSTSSGTLVIHPVRSVFGATKDFQTNTCRIGSQSFPPKNTTPSSIYFTEMTRAVDVRAGIFFSSQPPSGTHSSPTIECLLVSNASPLTSTTEVSCRSQPLDFVPSGRFVEIPFSSQVEINFNKHVEQAATYRERRQVKKFCHLGHFTTQVLPVVTSSCADRTARFSACFCELGNPASSAVRRVPRDANTSPLSAAAPLLLLWPMSTSGPGATSTFPSLGFFKTLGSNCVVIALSTRSLQSSMRAIHPLLSVAIA